MKTPIFQASTNTRLPKNIFDLTHERKMSCRMGELIPIGVMDCVPGDKISIKTNALVRFAPLIAPVMHSVNVYIHHFFVPNRILWSNWESFITGGEDGKSTAVAPYLNLNLNGVNPGALLDFMGLPVGQDVPSIELQQVSALPFAAYNKIYEDYYRDQNLIPEDKASWQCVDGQNVNGAGGIRTGMKKRAWQHDYFTSALPWTQRGDEAMLPLGQYAPIFGFNENNPPEDGFPTQNILRDATTGANYGVSGAPLQSDNQSPTGIAGGLISELLYVDLNGTNYADLSQATASSVIDVRRAFKLQEYLEKSARGGARYTEWLQVMFGVRSSDARLQRAEYIGGSSQPVKISEVLQTGATGTDQSIISTPQANMAGHGLSVGSGQWSSKYCEEHGYLISIMSIMPKTAYQQGIPRHFLRTDKFDYYTPDFAHIGEQAVEQREIFIPLGAQNNTSPFGYVPRYAEYKFIPNTVHGDFRDTLDIWHMGRKFENLPVLNKEFIECDVTDIEERIFAVLPQASTQNMYCHILNQVKAQRQMPIFGEPRF